MVEVPNEAQRIAQAVSADMLAKDRTSKQLGMHLLAVAPGQALLQMLVREDMLNGFDICHGGLIATLADSAFAVACNSYNELTVASGFGIDIVASAYKGDVLTAQAIEVSLTGRTGVYDVTVTNQEQKLVATFRGRSYRLKGRQVVPNLTL